MELKRNYEYSYRNEYRVKLLNYIELIIVSKIWKSDNLNLHTTKKTLTNALYGIKTVTGHWFRTLPLERRLCVRGFESKARTSDFKGVICFCEN